MFLQGESESVLTQEISEDDERSSIEFERYFCEILNVIFINNEKAKLLIVIDNLDRVDAGDSLKIWSTLQTFLQQKNPIGYSNSSFNRIWVLVPYDEEGLAKLWMQQAELNNYKTFNKSSDTNIKPENVDETSSVDENRTSDSRDCAKSFFDKCFQLRIEVPKLILTGWESFCKENIDKALIDWEDKEKNDVLNVLKWTRNSVDDIPTPREIKTYVNQIGLLRMHCDENISTVAISYFAIQKYMKFQTNREIEHLIVSEKLPPNNHKPIFHEELASELCGILFGVSSEKGKQLLLEPVIEQALSTKNLERTRSLSESHGNAFWTVLDLHLAHMNDFNRILIYSSTIWHGLWDSSPDRCKSFIKYLKAATNKITTLNFPTQNNVEEYLAMFSLLNEQDYDFLNLWKYIVNSLNDQMKKDDFDYLNGNKSLAALAACQKQTPSQYLLGVPPIESWIKWATVCKAEGLETYSLVKPNKAVFREVSSKIVVGGPIPDGLLDLIMYLVKGGELQWEPVITAIQNHIESSQGALSSNVFSVEIYQMLTLISTSGQKAQKSVVPILKNGAFYDLTFNLKSQGADKYAALLLAKCLPDELNSIQVAVIGNSAAGLLNVRNFWKTNSIENAQFVWDELTPNSDYKFIWDFAQDSENLLVGDVIRIAVNDNNPAFFNYTNPLELLEMAISITGDDHLFNDKLVNCFIAHGQIEKCIIEAKNLDIIPIAQVLNLVVVHTKNKKVIGNIIGNIDKISKEQWRESLTNNDWLTALVVSIKKHAPKLQLGDDLYEPLLTYLESWISSSIQPEDVQKNELLELITMLKSSFQTQLKNRLALYLIELGFNGNSDAVYTLIDHINISKLVSDGEEKIQNVLEVSIRNSDIAQMRQIDMILSHKESSEFKPSPHFSEVFQRPMLDLLNNSDAVGVAMIERLASRFGVDLSEPAIDHNVENLELENTE